MLIDTTAKARGDALRQITLVRDSNTLSRCVCTGAFTDFTDLLYTPEFTDHYTVDQLHAMLVQLRTQILSDLSSIVSKLVDFAGETIVRDLGSDISRMLISSHYTDSMDKYPLEQLTRELQIMQAVRVCIADSVR